MSQSSYKDCIDKDTMRMIGEAIIFASIQFSIGSVEMSSKFSVKNFGKDEETLENAIDALHDYMLIATIWTIGVALLLYSSYGVTGLVMGIFSNAVVISWIYFSYVNAFHYTSKKYNLSYHTK